MSELVDLKTEVERRHAAIKEAGNAVRYEMDLLQHLMADLDRLEAARVDLIRRVMFPADLISRAATERQITDAVQKIASNRPPRFIQEAT